ncbi:MAG: phosphate signaling complex protein PhoU [Xanthomonadales bacterium]|jgi:phosphate transport system protein|nr:phosphate signaling complex protein PhoU [Xanthomonadales bacterium]
MNQLNLGQHISQKFNEELEDVRRKVLHMGGIVEEQLVNALQAMLQGDTELAGKVVANDQRVNALEVEIDEECTLIVARRQPAATDLRLVMAVIRTINDLERIGDEIKRVAKMVREELDGSMEEEVRLEIEHMGDQVRAMLSQVLDAFARTDVNAAVAVARADHKVDLKYHAITRHLMTYMAQDHGSIPQVLNVLWAARALERIGDRCQNIAEYVIYLVIGKDVRHVSLDDVMAELQAQGAAD